MFGAFSPRHPKSSSPQKPWEDMKNIYAVFAGSVIREGSGKLVTIAALNILCLDLSDYWYYLL
jgi:hypothetical protein